MNLDKYFNTVEVTYSSVKKTLKDSDRKTDYLLHPQDFLRAFVYDSKLEDSIVIMSVNNLTEDDKKDLLYNDWFNLDSGLYKLINQNTRNILIIETKDV